MNEFQKIYVSWRKGTSSMRHIIGVLEQNTSGKFTFSYDKDAVTKAQKDGFTSYTGFPDVNASYNGNVLDVFSRRLIKSERPDIQNFYDFWEIEPPFKEDKFYLLGHTQGLLPTDNFEFLADYNIVEGLHFLTEIIALGKYQTGAKTLVTGDDLRFGFDKEYEYDGSDVKLFKGDAEVGYIKKIHCNVFHKPGAERLRLAVKFLDKNGTIKNVFVKVFL